MAQARVNVIFGADLKEFRTKMQNAEKQIQKIGKSMTKVGRGLSLGVTAPLLALGAAGVKAWDKQAKAIAQVEAGLKTTGNAVGYTSKQLQDMASELQNNSLFGDEDILQNATAQLLTFTNIAGEQFARTQQAALDLATRIGGDLKGASIQLGKALNDPVANLSALSKSGIQFSEDQKKMINSLVQTNRLADAQTIILDELEKQYGGSAKAASEAGLGPLQQLGMILGDLSEDFGKLITEAIQPFIAKIKEMALKFKALPESTKKVIAVIAGLAAVIGPLILTMGFMMTNVIPGLITMFTGLSTVVAGVGAKIVALNTAMGGTLAAASGVAAVVAAIVYGFTVMVQKITPAVTKMQTFFNMLKSGGNVTEFVNLQLLSNAEALVEEAKAQEDANKALAEANALLSQFNGLLDDSSKKTPPSSLLKPVATAFKPNTSVQGLNADLNKPGVVAPVEIPQLKTQAQIEAMDALIKKQEELRQKAEIVGGEVGYAFENMGMRMVDALGLADDGWQGFVKNMAATVIQLVAQMLAASISQSIAGATAAGASTGPASIFTTPAFIATAIGGVLAAFASIPKFAEGGLVSGPTLAMVGEYSGASNNPEVIAPLDKLRSLIGGSAGQKVTVDGEFIIDGRKLKLVLDRTNTNLNRNT